DPNGTIVYLGATTTASTSAPTAATTPAASSTPYQFTLNRQMWDEGPDILSLQQFLNTHGFPRVSTGWGSPGNETDTFGLHTYAALVKFQEANNLPATGYFGPLERGVVNAALASGISSASLALSSTTATSPSATSSQATATTSSQYIPGVTPLPG